MTCRHCQSDLDLCLLNLGTSPPANSYLNNDELSKDETWLPLRVWVCESCWLVQVEDFATSHQLFNKNYPYFSSYSRTWLSHCENYFENIIERFQLNKKSYVIEVASNDGCLLELFYKQGMNCLGIEPTQSTAESARSRGLNIVERFLDIELAKTLAKERGKADLIVANNVLPHVPDINNFVSACALLLKENGIITFEFQNVVELLEGKQFDTIYHEHFSYLSLTSTKKILQHSNLVIFDVEKIPTHGGSLRVFAQKSENLSRTISPRVKKMLKIEKRKGVLSPSFYQGFQEVAEQIRDEFLSFLHEAKNENKVVAAYGAAAKGNTLLNYARVTKELIAFVVDENPLKQGMLLPGSQIKILPTKAIAEMNPDFLIILPWNLQNEITSQLCNTGSWKGKLVTAIPSLKIFSLEQ